MSSETKQWLIEIVLLVLAVIALASAPAGPGSAANADPGVVPPGATTAARH